MSGIGIKNLEQIVRTLVEASVDTGVATGGGTDYLDDTSKSWPYNIFVGLIIEITGGTGAGQIRKIASNTSTRITVTPAWTIVPDVTSTYRIGFYGKIVGDITSWGGVAVTGRDITQDLAKLDIALSTLRDDLRSMFSPQSAYDSSTAAPLTVDLDTGPYGGRTIVEVWVKSSAAANFTVQGSRDGTNWRTVDTITLSAAGEAARGYQNAYRYIRVSTTSANNNEIEIVASR